MIQFPTLTNLFSMEPIAIERHAGTMWMSTYIAYTSNIHIAIPQIYIQNNEAFYHQYGSMRHIGCSVPWRAAQSTGDRYRWRAGEGWDEAHRSILCGCNGNSNGGLLLRIGRQPCRPHKRGSDTTEVGDESETNQPYTRMYVNSLYLFMSVFSSSSLLFVCSAGGCVVQ